MQIFITESVAETEAAGSRFAGHLRAGDVIALFGELGSGKTTFARGVCRGLGVTGDVSSPSFTLINEYAGQVPVYHFDFYRIGGRSETAELGYHEYFEGDGICLIEWPERIRADLPPARREVHFRNLFYERHENAREIRILERANTRN
jgi:tRNA threonylcarbamoyladenosine biosynthesis protein TsaE